MARPDCGRNATTPWRGSAQGSAAQQRKETTMCRPTTCEVCGKTTWKGCGKHIDSVKEQVPPDQWCDKNHTDEEYAAARKKSGFFGSFCK